MAKRYQRGNQNLYIEEEQTTRWPKDTKRDNQNLYIEEEQTTQCPKDTKRGNQNPYIEEEQTTQWPQDTKGVIRIRISKKNRQRNGHKIPKG